MINYTCNSFFKCDHYQKVGNCNGCGHANHQGTNARPISEFINIMSDIKVMKMKFPGIKKVHFNDPVTVVIWTDGTKTIVRCQEGDVFDPEKGLAMAISKKYFGNKGNYCEVFKKWVPEEKTETRTIIGKVARIDKKDDGIYATINANTTVEAGTLLDALRQTRPSELSIHFDVKGRK